MDGDTQQALVFFHVHFLRLPMAGTFVICAIAVVMEAFGDLSSKMIVIAGHAIVNLLLLNALSCVRATSECMKALYATVKGLDFHQHCRCVHEGNSKNQSAQH